jgi:ATP-dependent DNA helicase RecG
MSRLALSRLSEEKEATEVKLVSTKAMHIPPEDERVEWKQSLGEWKEIIETCAAFATSRGGIVYVGVTSDGTLKGVEIGKGTLEDLANKIKLNTDPPQFPAVEMTGMEATRLLVIRVEESPIKPVWAFGRPVKRVGRTNQYLKRDEAHRLMTVTTGRTWDALPCERFTEKDIDRKAVRDYLRRTGMKLSTPLDDLLKNLGMPETSSGFCNAAILLFGKHPQSFLIETEVKCGRFEGTDSVNFLDERTFEGNILGQLDEALAFVKRNTRQAIRITGKPEREIVPEYPDEAVRESLINALCHRDYASVGTVQVRIYDDRLEVWNPGRLPPDLTIEALYRQHASHPRNPRLAHALHRARLIEHWGTGTLRIIEACSGYGLTPEFHCQTGCFITRLKKKAVVAADLGGGETPQVSPQVTPHVLRLVATVQGEMTRDAIQKAIGIKDRKDFRRRYLHPALSAGLLEMTVPDKPNSRLQKYRLTEKGHRLLERHNP